MLYVCLYVSGVCVCVCYVGWHKHREKVFVKNKMGKEQNNNIAKTKIIYNENKVISHYLWYYYKYG